MRFATDWRLFVNRGRPCMVGVCPRLHSDLSDGCVEGAYKRVRAHTHIHIYL